MDPQEISQNLSIEALTELAFTDELTKLKNRRWLFDYLDGWCSAEGTRDQNLSLVVLDLDKFKLINDTHGHLAGDEAIKWMAETITNSIRSNDIFVRYAGDEFVLVLPGLDKRTGEHVAKQLCARLARTPLELESLDEPLHVTISLGVAEFPGDADTPRGLFECADAALYVAKEGGRNCVAVYGVSDPSNIPIPLLLKNFPGPKLIGRVSDLIRCQSVCMDAENDSQVVIVKGVDGVGKTRLLRELQASREQIDQTVLWADCLRERQHVPYAPLAEAVHSIFDKNPRLMERAVTLLDEGTISTLANWLSELGEPSNIALVSDSEEGRRAVFSAWLSLLQVIATGQPVVLILDDLEFADRATLAIFRFLAGESLGEEKRPAIAAFLAHNLDNAGLSNSPALKQFLDEIGLSDRSATIELEGLDTESVGDLVDSILQRHSMPSDFAHKLENLTKGNPLFIEEVLVALILSHSLVREDGSWSLEAEGVVLPNNLTDVLLVHLESLDEESADAVLQASALGTHFHIDLFCRVLEFNPGRALQVLDKGIGFRLLEVVEGTGNRRYRFVHRCLRDVTYEVVGAEVRQRVHARAVSLGDQVVVSDLEEALDDVNWHAERAGGIAGRYRPRAISRYASLFSDDEIDDYFQIAGSEAAPRADFEVAEASSRLTDVSRELVAPVLTALVTVHRGHRMYPPGSRYTIRAVRKFLRSLDEIFLHLPAITLKEKEGRLEVNSELFEEGTFGLPEELTLDLLRSAGVHSITLNRLVKETEVERLATGLIRFDIMSGPDAWSEHLKDAGCKGVGVVPKEYRAVTRDQSRLSSARALQGIASQRRDEKADLLSQIVRYMVGVAEAVHLFPIGSKTTEQALDALVNVLGLAYRIVPTVNVCITAEGVLLNDARIDERTFGPSVHRLQAFMDSRKLRSISLHAGVSKEELASFFTVPEIDETTSEAPVYNFAHIEVDQYFFVAADAQGGVVSGGSGDSKKKVRLDRATFLRRVLEGSASDLLSDDILTRVPTVLSDTWLDGDHESTQAVVGKLFGALEEIESEMRNGALVRIARMLSSSSQLLTREILRIAQPHLRVLLQQERDERALNTLIELSETLIRDCLAGREVENAARLIRELGRTLQDDMRAPATCRENALEAIGRIMHSTEFNCVLNALWSPSKDRREHALFLLESCGAPAASSILEEVIRAKNTESRQLLARILAGMNVLESVQDGLNEWIGPSAESPIVVALLEVLEIIDPSPVEALFRAFSHPDKVVKQAASKVVHRLEGDARREVLSRLLEIPDERTRAAAAKLVGKTRPPRAASLLLPLLSDETNGETVHVEVCNALGRIRDPKTIQPLRRLLRHGSLLSRFSKKAASTDVRVAALSAISRMPGRLAMQTLTEHSDDSDERIRTAARHAVSGFHRVPSSTQVRKTGSTAEHKPESE